MQIFRVEDPMEVNMTLIKDSKTPYPQIMNAIHRGLTLTLKDYGMNLAICVMEKEAEAYKLIHLAVDPEYQRQGYGRELLLHAMDHVMFMGVPYVDCDAGNADVSMFIFLQKMGFRVAGVTPDYFAANNEPTQVENAIVNRDMLHYRADLPELVRQ